MTSTTPQEGTAAAPLHWHADGVSLVLDGAGPLLPRVLHWGAELRDCSDAELAAPTAWS
ncbi:hypothetical protein AB0368_29130 [Actinoplanes sp. NPDC051475]|uniref:hypothetical protein n=1 Tax=Actinoplanes sp. NPDC051475 TaxID=3157225 RepID=UPI003450770B